MKRTLKTFILVVLSVVFFNASTGETPTVNEKVAVLNFETETIDYGTIKQNSNGLRTFNFINTGSAPLLITRIKTSCGCTVPSYSKTPILPGESGEILIKYSTKRLGAFTKTITVISNAKGGNKILKVKGKVVAL
ncbi:DUF1573 domain-containing protein [Winogradskyella alexanderae]|uniref:DUF1573 domain-containing protein n=1 Tax=Winogradskyella alexanderae TaxID=2877123 RepID=A0ABS7XV28_9FLAO|nr:DUF1573 domain-containing protein [Winogradskyella alexanderae]MCA0133254.1 DUF1573 domain-containing protein [Winogradskyella alexanderae]